MRNPLKKITKKINFRLASNAAQHSSKVETPHQLLTTNRIGDSAQSATELEHDDPLFNNRSSKLRLALAESRKSTSNVASPARESPVKKKKGGRRISFGTASRKTNAEKPLVSSTTKQASAPLQQATESPTASSSSGTSNEETAPQSPSRTKLVAPDNAAETSVSTPKRSFDAPTFASLQMVRDKALASGPSSKPSTTTPVAPVILDPNLERIARAAAALDNTGNELFERGEYDKAMASYVKALKLKNRTLLGSQQIDTLLGTPSRAQPIDSLLGDPKRGVSCPPIIPEEDTTASVKSETATTAENASAATAQPGPIGADDLWISVATSINNIGYLRQQSGQASADETMQAYQNSLQIKRRVLGKDNLSVGKTLNNLGTVHYLKREYDQALEAYREALQIMLASLGPNHLDVGTVHSNIGDVFWAQSGDAKYGEDSPQRKYQNSRDSALRHYRQSLEIRWEELKDHHDPKVIRLLEKIAALEMGESFLALIQNIHTHRQSPREGDTVADEGTVVDPDEAIEAETSLPLVYKEARNLHLEVKEDVKAVDMMERKLAIDMVKDKLRLLREMKKLNLNLQRSLDEDELGVSLASGRLTPVKAKPLSPVQRSEALSAVKERLHQLRASRSQEPDVMQRYTPCATSDLKEADCSPSNYFLSQRASLLLHRTLGKPPSYPEANDDLLARKMFFSMDQPGSALMDDISEISDFTRSTRCSLSVSRRATQALEKGIDVLRSQTVDQDATAVRDSTGSLYG